MFERLRLQLGFWSGIFAGAAYIGWLCWTGSWLESCALLAISALAATISYVAFGKLSLAKLDSSKNTQLHEDPPALVDKGVDGGARESPDC